MPTSIAVELAALAHRAWCEQMFAASWRYGPVFDKAAMTHDALVPFEQLPRLDRRRSLRVIEGSGLAKQMVKLIDYPRGPDQEFAIEEMRVGLPVALPDTPSERGAVESWETDAEGELRLIRVRWPDGDLSEHAPVAGELRRV